ncbi:MAG: hypothetical protein AB1896_08430 [Thermodesulfobacteriota bacterium]
MEELITGPLAEALARGRDRFNAKFAQARRVCRNLDPAAFADFLGRVVEPIVRATALEAPAAADAVTEALFDLALELLSRDHFNPAFGIDQVWREMLPLLPRLLIHDPRGLAAGLSNAVYNLTLEVGARAEKWTAAMLKTAPLCRDADEFLRAGQVLAWRCGLAHYRASALEVWAGLPDRLKYFTLGLDPSEPAASLEEVRRALDDPWRRPENLGRKTERLLVLAGPVGGFRGFGGQFLHPPEVTRAEDGLYAFDGEYCFSLHADAFGAMLRRFGKDLPPGAGLADQGAFTLSRTGEVDRDGRTARFPVLSDASSWAADGSTLAVTLERSHYVFLVALAEKKAAP